MDLLFLGAIVFLFLLAIFHLSVGVSNDAVNFLNSAVGSKAATFKTIIIIASIGVFAGAAMSNGMMDIARHGIFRPEHFSFYEVMCIFMAVIVTDIILIDAFNSLGMPTSTTVSLIFELLGATFIVSLLKMAGDGTDLRLNDLLNTEKALSVIIGIFLSVAIAFIFGSIVQYISRLIFTFEYRSRMKWKAGIFGGIALTFIVYFLLIKGIKDLSFMTPELKQWIGTHTPVIIGGCLVVFTVLMQLLHMLGVNILRIVVLSGTFALAMAFAGNDLVNFIGVPLTGFASFQDYTANGAGNPDTFLMDSLNGPADTPVYFLIGAGLIMVVSLATSKKARKVVNTSVNLARQDGGDEMFGSSRLSRKIVRSFISISTYIVDHTPVRVRRWINRRFDTTKTEMEHEAAFDMLRGAVNLVLAAMLIALGTSLKLPLSTTYVTFMVAMGTSLADRAWGRESAVFRITGVISVIGGWFITAGIAFIGAGLIVLIMHFGGKVAMILSAIAVMTYIIYSSRRDGKTKNDNGDDTLFRTILSTEDRQQAWELLRIYIAMQYNKFMTHTTGTYNRVASGFIDDDAKSLSTAAREIYKEKNILKNSRRKETLCLRRLSKKVAISQNAWLHLFNNSCISMNYNLQRINEVCKEHVDNNFRPLPQKFAEEFRPVQKSIIELLERSGNITETPSSPQEIEDLRRQCNQAKDRISAMYHALIDKLHTGDDRDLAVVYVYINLLQETREMISSLRKLLRAADKLQLHSATSPIRNATDTKNVKHAIR